MTLLSGYSSTSGLQIGDVDRPPVEHRASRSRSTYQRKRTNRSNGDRALVRDDAEPIDLEDRGIEGVAQTGGARQHGREYGVNVGRGARDDAENFGRGGLLLVRLGQRLPEAFDLALRIRV